MNKFCLKKEESAILFERSCKRKSQTTKNWGGEKGNGGQGKDPRISILSVERGKAWRPSGILQAFPSRNFFGAEEKCGRPKRWEWDNKIWVWPRTQKTTLLWELSYELLTTSPQQCEWVLNDPWKECNEKNTEINRQIFNGQFSGDAHQEGERVK